MRHALRIGIRGTRFLLVDATRIYVLVLVPRFRVHRFEAICFFFKPTERGRVAGQIMARGCGCVLRVGTIQRPSHSPDKSFSPPASRNARCSLETTNRLFANGHSAAVAEKSLRRGRRVAELRTALANDSSARVFQRTARPDAV